MAQTHSRLAAADGVLGLANVLDAAVLWLGRVAAALIVGLVLLVATNVLLRYFFSIGSVWSQELEWHVLALIATFGLASTYATDDHVRVDILYRYAGVRYRAIVDLASALLVLGISILLIRYALPYIAQSFAGRESSADPGGLPMRYLLKGSMIVGLAALGAQGISRTVRSLHALRVSGSV